MSSIKDLIANYKVSSVLNKNSKEFGKQHLFDGNDETCWNSHQGKPQYIYLEFKQPVNIAKVHMIFQGGFVGKDCQFLIANGNEELTYHSSFYPDDSSVEQVCNYYFVI
ncbi:hypothetical protein FDP41_003458 [Naegleria fowleri]|uniref:F5/8 type C domain-containing protein n=1 Tax=Naegleria fowleri TaxID=5763 RepID=A0A6A5BQV7_NAEFO|nr:uncharacterized protein FDP41_003458 [Naegleria fowleri]KAF0977466.1 hypothetical protein FDP41_003458 [Naegleria fowleri]